MDEKDFSELAAGHALHALSPDDLRAFEAARLAHPEWERWVEADAATAAALGDTVSDALPPLTLRSTLLSQIAARPQLPEQMAADAAAAEPVERRAAKDPMVEPAPTTTTIQAVSRRNWTRALFGLAASLVVLVTLGFGAVTINELVTRSPAAVALDEIEGAPDAQAAGVELEDGGTATVHWSPSLGKTVLVSNGLPEIADDQSFELWFVRDGTPIAAGTFTAEDGASTALLEGAMEEGDVIAVTVEAEGGSPSGQPTTDPIVAIET